MRRTLLLISTSLALAAPPSWADEIVLGLDNALQVESNLFKTSVGEQRDGIYEISPSILFRRRDEKKLNYELLYEPSFNAYFTNSEVNGVDQFVRGATEYRPVELGRAWLRGSYTDYRSVRASDAPTAGIPDIVGGAQGRVKRFFVDTGYDHELTRLTRIETALALQGYRFDTPNNVDSTGVGGDVALRNEFLPFADAGLSMFASFRKYQQQLTQPSSDNVVLNPNFVLRIEPIETLVLDVRVGPAFIRTQQAGGGATRVSRFLAGTVQGQTFGAVFDPSCVGSSGLPEIDGCPIILAPALADMLGDQVVVDYAPGQTPTAIDDHTVTAFALANLTKTESWGAIEAEYFRREDAAAGSGSTTIRDSITGTITMHPGYLLDVRLRANWNRRRPTSNINRSNVEAGPSTVSTGDGRFFAESVGLIPNVVSSDFEIKQIWADVIVGRPIILDGLRLEGRFQYLKQTRPDQPIVGTFDNFFGELRLIYRFTAFDY